jgi:hypothetical protein
MSLLRRREHCVSVVSLKDTSTIVLTMQGFQPCADSQKQRFALLYRAR